MLENQSQQYRCKNPDRNNRSKPGATNSLLPQRSFRSELCHKIGRNQPDRKHNAKRHDDDVIDLTENGDEVGCKVDGAQGAGSDNTGKGLRVPGDARIATGEP